MTDVDRRFLIFKRVSQSPWLPHGVAEDGLSKAIGIATGLASKGWDQSCVMEVGGTDALPMFTFIWAIRGRIPVEGVQ